MNRLLAPSEIQAIKELAEPGTFHISRKTADAILRLLDYARRIGDDYPPVDLPVSQRESPGYVAGKNHDVLDVYGKVLAQTPYRVVATWLVKSFNAHDRDVQQHSTACAMNMGPHCICDEPTALESCIRAAIFDVIDAQEWHFDVDARARSLGPGPTADAYNRELENQATQTRVDFADKVVKRVRDMSRELPRKLDPRPTTEIVANLLNQVERECPGCVAAHSGIQGFADRHDEQCRDEHADDSNQPIFYQQVGRIDRRPGLAVKAHLAAAEAWEMAESVLRTGQNYFTPSSYDRRMSEVEHAVQRGQETTGLANEATKAAPSNVDAFNATAAAILAASMVLPAEAAAAHRRAAAAYNPETAPAEFAGDVERFKQLDGELDAALASLGKKLGGWQPGEALGRLI